MKSAEEFRKAGQEHLEAMQALVAKLQPPYPDVVAAIVAGVAAKTNAGLAHLVETLEVTSPDGEIKPPPNRLLKQIVARNHEMRKAATHGDWDKLSEIAGLHPDE